MAENTKIEWCDSTFNPVVGCQKVSAACDFCYAEAQDKRFGGNHWGPNAARRRTTPQNWNKPRKWHREADKFFSEHGRRRRVFCASMADVFDNKWEDEWRADLWGLIRECSSIDWLLLTKRPQNIPGMIPEFWDDIKGHIWLGRTVENAENLNKAKGHEIFMHVDAAVHFLSCEPLLSGLDLEHIDLGNGRLLNGLTGVEDAAGGNQVIWRNKIGWVITGGESGLRKNARYCNPDHVRRLQAQCARNETPFLFKQWGNWVPWQPADAPFFQSQNGQYVDGHVAPWLDKDGEALYEMDGTNWQVDYGDLADESDTLTLYQYTNKATAGRELDGITYTEFPRP